MGYFFSGSFGSDASEMYVHTHKHTGIYFYALPLVCIIRQAVNALTSTNGSRLKLNDHEMVKIHNPCSLFAHITVVQYSIDTPSCCFHCFCTIPRPKP